MRMLAALPILLGVAACSAQQVYDGTREWRLRECTALLEPERGNCERRARERPPETDTQDAEHVR